MEAFVQGPVTQPPWRTTLGYFLRSAAAEHGSKTALMVPWQAHRSTFRDLDNRSQAVARALLYSRVRFGDHVAVMAGNRHEYVDLFLGAGRVGCLVACINNLYTPTELRQALVHSSCTRVFIASSIGSRDMSQHILEATLLSEDPSSKLREVIIIGDGRGSAASYTQFLQGSQTSVISESKLQKEEDRVKPTDGILLQFTSGTTGQPKASVLTSMGVLNNGRYVGDRMQLASKDVIVCPPPLFHTFGIVVGLLVGLTHACPIVLPSDTFNAEHAVRAVIEHQGTVLMGVPTMFLAELEWMAKAKKRPSTLRTGIIGGTTVSKSIMERIEREMGMDGMLIAYGTTETSPITFLCSLSDSHKARFETVGQVLPNTTAKIIDKRGRTLKRQERGELCVSGYCLQLGYYGNHAKTKEVMQRDEHGVLWMRTGDEAFIDSQGYCHITGRLKDIIIRGGENIYPAEIEECLVRHGAIEEASVVGIKHERYGEVVAAFLRSNPATLRRPDDEEVRSFVGASLGRPKVPKHIFWMGSSGVGSDFPKTGSGKHQKHILSGIGLNILSVKA